ncbi:MAG TPA: carboxypeptidase-like regulatory domain-containing protein [Gammaproteobacteria bacterium]|nr:carboxypeptidase-like regulatory domain-containing protein [Gammaproteobacteria bacterium]
MGVLRYLVFIAVGLVVASVLFLGLSFLVSANFDSSVAYVERWIVRVTCDQYELAGTVRDTRGRPVPYAVVEVSFLGERLTTRSNVDGTFKLAADETVCDRRPPRSVQLLVVAEDFRPKTTAVPYDAGSIDVTLDARDFRP